MLPKRVVLFSFAAWVTSSFLMAADWYVDAAGSGGDGKSWAHAWKRLNDLEGLSPGDSVYISGGPSGHSVVYPMASAWTAFCGGNPWARITYRIGQDPLHNGTAVFFHPSGRINWLPQVSNIVVSGDAGDGRCHFKLVGWGALIIGDGQTNVRISYVRADSLDEIGDFNPGKGIEIDHGIFDITDLAADHASYARIEGSSWDDSSFHDNLLYIPNIGNGKGCDGLQWVGKGFSIFRNHIIGYVAAYTGDQHQDGWQGTGGSYIKIYGNYFQDIANYPVFGDAFYGSFSHLYVCGNVAVMTIASLQRTDPPQGIVICPDGGWFEKNHYWPVFEDIVVANNVIADYGPNHAAINLKNNRGQKADFLHCVVANNVAVNSGEFALEPSVVTEGNARIDAQEGVRSFRRYLPLSPSNDFHLSEQDHYLRRRGVNLADHFPRQEPGTQPLVWDIGAFPFGTEPNSLF